MLHVVLPRTQIPILSYLMHLHPRTCILASWIIIHCGILIAVDSCSFSRIAQVTKVFIIGGCRYVRNVPNTQNLNLAPFSMQNFHPPYLHYDSVMPQLGQLPTSQASIGYRNTVMSPYCAIGLNQTSRDAVYMQWSSPAMMYPQPYDQFRHAVFQVRFFYIKIKIQC